MLIEKCENYLICKCFVVKIFKSLAPDDQVSDVIVSWQWHYLTTKFYQVFVSPEECFEVELENSYPGDEAGTLGLYAFMC